MNGIWGKTSAWDMITCPECRTVVCVDDASDHEEWHDEQNRLINQVRFERAVSKMPVSPEPEDVRPDPDAREWCPGCHQEMRVLFDFMGNRKKTRDGCYLETSNMEYWCAVRGQAFAS